MKKIALVMVCVYSMACNSNSASQKTQNNSSSNINTVNKDAATSSGKGSISCSMDGSAWKNDNATAIQTGSSILNIASDEAQTEAISIILNHPTTGSFNFNHIVSGSYTDASGASYGSKDGTGTVIITKFTAAAGNTDGIVEGNFFGTFNFNPTKKHVLTDGKFSMPVKLL